MVPRLKKGFTLIEMSIVMGIISILSLISVSALLANSNYQRLSKSAEEMVNLIREAQNRSVSIVKDSGGGDTKAWEFTVDNGTKTYAIKALNANGTSLEESTTPVADSDQGSLPGGATVNVDYYAGNNPATLAKSNVATFYSVFSTPFARAYLGASSIQAGDCVWKDGASPDSPRVAKDWYIAPECTTMFSPSHPGYAQINLSYKNSTITIRVNTNGDISYQ